MLRVLQKERYLDLTFIKVDVYAKFMLKNWKFREKTENRKNDRDRLI